MTDLLYGGKHVADALGVTNQALCNWRSRYNDTPPPTHQVIDGMPLWDENGLEAWRAWQEQRDG